MCFPTKKKRKSIIWALIFNLTYAVQRTKYYQIEFKWKEKTYRFSTRTKIKKEADGLEADLKKLIHRSRFDSKYEQILDALAEKKIDIFQIGKALFEGNIEVLLDSINIVKIEDVVAEYKLGLSAVDSRGFQQLEEYLPNGDFEQLCNAKTIQALLEHIQRERGINPNSVHRHAKGHLSKLITKVKGKGQRNLIFADVKYLRVDDTREVDLTSEQLQNLLKEIRNGCTKRHDEEAVLVTKIAILTGADINPILRAKDEDIRQTVDGITLFLRDFKTDKRPRTVLLVGEVGKELLEHGTFNILYSRYYTIFRKALFRANLQTAVQKADKTFDNIRPKDLRSVSAVAGTRIGLSAEIIAENLGNSEEMVRKRYAKRKTILSAEISVKLAENILGTDNSTDT